MTSGTVKDLVSLWWLLPRPAAETLNSGTTGTTVIPKSFAVIIRLAMRECHPRRVSALMALTFVILVGLCAYLLGPSESAPAGRPLDYWLDGLELTGYRRTPPRFHNDAAELAWVEQMHKRHERSSAVLKQVGADCLPELVTRIAAPRRDPHLVVRFLRTLHRRAYDMQLTDQPPQALDSLERQRAQALAAILLLEEDAKPAIPWLVRELHKLDAQRRLRGQTYTRDAAWRYTEEALWHLDPVEYERCRRGFSESETGDAKPEGESPADDGGR